MNAPESKVAVEPYLLESRDASGVVTLTLNRPQQFNALSVEMMTALQAALDAVAADPSARVLVLAGAGKAFCAGHDLKQMKEDTSLDTYRALFAQCAKLMLTIQRMPQPVIARVHGVATAAGCQLVATCDLAVAVEGARFGVSGINVGLFCTTPGVALARNVGRKEAFEMLVTGDLIDAQTARERGLVNRVVAADQLDAEVAKLAASIVVEARDRRRDGQGDVLPAGRGRHRGCVPDGGPDDGVQPGRPGGAGGPRRLHGQAQAELGAAGLTLAPTAAVTVSRVQPWRPSLSAAH